MAQPVGIPKLSIRVEEKEPVLTVEGGELNLIGAEALHMQLTEKLRQMHGIKEALETED